MNDPARISEIRARLAGVAGKLWKYNPAHKMFVGSTNALEMYHGVLDLGRSQKEWTPHESGNGYRLSNSTARIKALGEFLEQCREDIAFLLARCEALESQCDDLVGDVMRQAERDIEEG
jgi:hypothetical protein